MKRWKKILGTILAAAVIVTGITVPECNVSNVKAKDYGISNPRIGAYGSVTWDKIKFGSYKQSVKFGEPEPIKWRILSVDEDNNALLMADKGLYYKAYNEKGVESIGEDGKTYMDYSCTWETSTLRTWLNEDFYNEAFTESEQAEIKKVTVKNDDNSEYGTEGGNDTEDKVYLLSIDEVKNSAYGFGSTANMYFKNTDYAAMHCQTNIGSKGVWWLRSPGKESDNAVGVSDYGYFQYDWSTILAGAIRPVLQLNLSTSLVHDAGKVTADGNEVSDYGDGYNNPQKMDNKSVWDCVYFGRYKQNNISEPESIEWRVLSVKGDEALLLSDKALDCMYYDNDDRKIRDVTWETCTLRKQLNSVFYDEAFNESEKSAIKQVTVKTDDNSEYGTDGGNDTLDKVFVLSIEEARKTEYGFDSSYDSFVMNGMGSRTRDCSLTAYAIMNSTRLIPENRVTYASWVLRSPGVTNKGVTYIVNGSFWANEMNASSGYDIRPAIWIDLTSPVWETSGTVSTGAGSIDISQTTPEPDSTPEPDVTQTPDSTDRPDVTQEPANTPAPTIMPDLNPAPTIQPSATPNATQVTATSETNTQTADAVPNLKSFKLTSVKCKKGAKQITGKVSVSSATVKIKVGSRAYKKAIVKGKKFTLKVPRLKKNTKVTIKVTKSGYKSLVKTYKTK